jgi:hypothetical protein
VYLSSKWNVGFELISYFIVPPILSVEDPAAGGS